VPPDDLVQVEYCQGAVPVQIALVQGARAFVAAVYGLEILLFDSGIFDLA